MQYDVSRERFEAVNVITENRMINSENTLRVVKGPEKLMRFDENTYARLKDLTFRNGIIEVRMLSRLLPDAPDFARGFIGIAFRISPDDSEFESFYIRPANAMTDDPVRRAHGCQYFSYPGYTFAYFREYGIGGYEAPMNCGLDYSYRHGNRRIRSKQRTSHDCTYYHEDYSNYLYCNAYSTTWKKYKEKTHDHHNKWNYK